KESSVRTAAARALGQVGPDAKPAIAALDKALRDPDVGVRRQASAALSHVGKGAVAKLIQTLSAKGPEGRWDAIVALEHIGPEAKAAVPELTEMLTAREPFLRWEAATALGRIGSAAKSAVPELTKLLRDTDPVVRRSAATALGDLGPEAKSAFELLQQLHKSDRSSDVQDAAAEALWKIDPGAAKKAGVP